MTREEANWFGNLVLGGGAFLVVLSFLVSWVVATPVARQEGAEAGRVAALSLINSQRAMVFHGFRAKADEVPVGGDLTLTYTYDKRADCHPPAAEFGELYFKVAQRDADGAYRRFMRIDTGLFSTEPPGFGLVTEQTVDLPNLRPGEYALGTRAIFHCDGETQPHIIVPPVVTFRVKA